MKKIFIILSCVALIACMTVMAFATGTTTVTPSDWSSVIDAITAQISVSTIVTVLAGLVTAGIGFVFLWWGVRKAISSLMSAFKKGRVSI